MAKLKGKGGQQHVVVEHVTVAAGGQAIVGNVTRGVDGHMATNEDEPNVPWRGGLGNENRRGDLSLVASGVIACTVS